MAPVSGQVEILRLDEYDVDRCRRIAVAQPVAREPRTTRRRVFVPATRWTPSGTAMAASAAGRTGAGRTRCDRGPPRTPARPDIRGRPRSARGRIFRIRPLKGRVSPTSIGAKSRTRAPGGQAQAQAVRSAVIGRHQVVAAPRPPRRRPGRSSIRNSVSPHGIRRRRGPHVDRPEGGLGVPEQVADVR